MNCPNCVAKWSKRRMNGQKGEGRGGRVERVGNVKRVERVKRVAVVICNSNNSKVTNSSQPFSTF